MDQRLLEAAQMSAKAVSIAENSLGTSHATLHALIAVTAQLFESAEAFESAEEFYLKANKLTETTLKEDDANIARAMDAAASFYIRRQNYDKALELNAKVIAWSLTHYGERHPVYMAQLTNFASNLKLAQRDEDAAAVENEMKELRQRLGMN
jgi:hypothetical protein